MSKLMRKFGTFAVVVAASAALIATPALAVRKRVTTTGVVTEGTDVGGRFGMAGADLAGKTLTLSFVYDTALGTKLFDDATRFALFQNGSGPFLLASATIDGVTFRLPSTNIDSLSRLVRQTVASGDTSVLASYSQEVEVNTDTEYSFFSSYAGFSGLTDASNFDYAADVRLTGAAVSRMQSFFGEYNIFSDGSEVDTLVQSTVGSLAVTGNVPEPASWAMMIAGFGLVGATMRRRREAGAATAVTA